MSELPFTPMPWAMATVPGLFDKKLPVVVSFSARSGKGFVTSVSLGSQRPHLI